MDIKVTQCPSCGGPIESPGPGTFVECGYCGSSLRIVRSASGAPLAELAGIKVDTALIARERAR